MTFLINPSYQRKTLFNDIFRTLDSIDDTSISRLSQNFDVYTDKDGMLAIECYLAGYSDSDIKVEIDDSTRKVYVSAERARDKDRTYITGGSSRTQAYQTVYTVPRTFDTKTGETTYENGLLKIQFSPAEKREIPRRELKI
jgi:HSP20 family molecular chaperone IbpA